MKGDRDLGEQSGERHGASPPKVRNQDNEKDGYAEEGWNRGPPQQNILPLKNLIRSNPQIHSPRQPAYGTRSPQSAEPPWGSRPCALPSVAKKDPLARYRQAAAAAINHEKMANLGDTDRGPSHGIVNPSLEPPSSCK